MAYDSVTSTQKLSSVTGRLSSIPPKYGPWQHAEQLKTCFLYWAPVGMFPTNSTERSWFTYFFDLFVDAAKAQFQLRCEPFLQAKSLDSPLKQIFLNKALEFAPLIGLSRRPGASLPPLPTLEDAKAIQDGKALFDSSKFMGDYCYWLRGKQDQEIRKAFFGHAGLTLLFMKPDSKTEAPKLPFPEKIRQHPAFAAIFAHHDLDALYAKTFALLNGFLTQSKQLFGAGLENDPQFRGLPFILPLMSSADFFAKQEHVEKVFSLCDIYVTESETDRGILVASKFDLGETMSSILKQMEQVSP